MAILVCESGADKRKIFQLLRSQMVCGRGAGADILLNDPFSSSEHFRMVCKDNFWFAEDLKSANGIEVNDIRQTAARLKNGDLIKAGSTYLRFYERDETADEAAHEGLPSIDGYQIFERIGVGGMGEVYRACQLSLDREVAIKTLSSEHARDREFVEKFFSEARASGNLNHANIVQVHDVGESGGVCFICMEYVGGGDLTARLREKDKLPPPEVIRIALEVARGLEFAESKGIVHCDIKPDNIMFTTGGMAKIADLGISRSVSDFQERRKEVFGSPHYMAPEQAMGKAVDHRADLYALGCTLFRMLCGRTPFAGASAREVMKKQVMEDHPDILQYATDCPPELADIVDYLMEKKPEDRCPSAADLIGLLEKVTGAPKSKARSKTRKTPPAILAAASAKSQALRASVGIKPGRDKNARRLSLGIYLAVAAGIILTALVILLLSINPVESAFKTVAQLQEAGEYGAAIGELRRLSDNETLDDTAKGRVNAKVAELEKLQALKEVELNFRRLWNSYLEMRQNGTSDEKLSMQLEYLVSVFGGNKDFMTIIDRERTRLSMRTK